MSYKNDIFVDNCIMRLVQLAAAIRQNNDRLACQEFDRMEKEFDAMDLTEGKEELECQNFDRQDIDNCEA